MDPTYPQSVYDLSQNMYIQIPLVAQQKYGIST
jgi:hypothetical protein